MLPKYDILMDSDNQLERINAQGLFPMNLKRDLVAPMDLFVANKNYLMVVKTLFAKYEFVIKKLPLLSGGQYRRLWENFELLELTIYEGDKKIHWEKGIEAREVIPDGENLPILDPKIVSIISPNWPIWINVEGVWITPKFDDVPSFLYREVENNKFNTGIDVDQKIQISFEEINNPMAINRVVF